MSYVLSFQMKQKIEEKLQAIQLREQGYSVNEIVERVGVAKSSVSTWVRNVLLSPQARTRLLTKIKLGQVVSAERKHEQMRNLLDEYFQAALQEMGGQEFQKIHKKILCALLYWCEGVKSHYNGVAFINSDPRLIQLFLGLFRESFDVDEEKIKPRIHLHEYHDPQTQLHFWAQITGIPEAHFSKPYLKPHTGKRIRKDYPGCLSIRYGSNDMARRLLSVAKAFFVVYGGVAQLVEPSSPKREVVGSRPTAPADLIQRIS